MSRHTISRLQRASRVYLDRKAARAKLQYAQQETPYGNDVVQGDHELDLWDERDPNVTPEQEMALWKDALRQRMPEDMARAHVGKTLYPFRERLMKSGERYLDVYEQAKYADRMARRSEARRAGLQTPTEGGEPT